MAVAIDIVCGSQLTGPGSIDNTQADRQGATLTGGQGSSSLGEVSADTAPTALTGQLGQTADAT